MKLIVFIGLMLLVTLFFSANSVIAQQVVNEAVQEEIKETASETVTSQSLPIDITTITGILGTAGGLLWKDRKDKQELTEKLKEAVDILMNLDVSTIKIYNAAIVYPEKSLKQILELKASNNGLEAFTIANEIAISVNRLQKFMMVNFHTPMPNMSIPSERIINNTTSNPENKVQQISTTNTTASPPPS